MSLEEEISSQQMSFLTAIRTPSSGGAVPAEYVIIIEEEFTISVSFFDILLGTYKPGFGAYDDVRFGITC